MTDDLGLVGSQYNIALTVFFIPYALLEVPSNIVLKLMRPSWWIAIMMFCWGVVMYVSATSRMLMDCLIHLSGRSWASSKVSRVSVLPDGFWECAKAVRIPVGDMLLQSFLIAELLIKN
jgi:hypothetical protein